MMLPGTQKPAHTLHVLMSLIKTPHEQLLTLNFDRMDGKGTLTGFQQGIKTLQLSHTTCWLGHALCKSLQNPLLETSVGTKPRRAVCYNSLQQPNEDCSKRTIHKNNLQPNLDLFTEPHDVR